MLKLAFAVSATFVICGAAHAQSDADPFYLPQADQPFEGKVKTRIGKLEFEKRVGGAGAAGRTIALGTIGDIETCKLQ